MEPIGLDHDKNQNGMAHDEEPREEDGRDYDEEAKEYRRGQDDWEIAFWEMGDWE